MKKFYLIILFVLAAFINQSKAQYLIPSYNVPVEGKATFQENDVPKSGESITRIRTLKVRSYISTLRSQTCATIWLFTLDGQESLGPFSLPCDETVGFEIDEQYWGVYMETDTEILVDVWIE